MNYDTNNRPYGYLYLDEDLAGRWFQIIEFYDGNGFRRAERNNKLYLCKSQSNFKEQETKQIVVFNQGGAKEYIGLDSKDVIWVYPTDSDWRTCKHDSITFGKICSICAKPVK